MSWVASDVGHEDVNILHLKELILGILQTNNVIVNVAVNSPKRLESFELLCGLDVSDVAGMPNLVNVLEKVKDLRDDGPVGI